MMLQKKVPERSKHVKCCRIALTAELVDSLDRNVYHNSSLVQYTRGDVDLHAVIALDFPVNV